MRRFHLRGLNIAEESETLNMNYEQEVDEVSSVNHSSKGT